MSFFDIFGKNAVFPSEVAVLDTEPSFGPTGTEFTPSYQAPLQTQVVDTASYGPSGGLVGLVHLPDVSEVVSSATFGVSSASTGTVVLPSIADVRLNVAFGPASTLIGSLVVGGGSGGDYSEQLDRIEAQTSRITGTPLEWCGPVKDGGYVILHKGIDYVSAAGTLIQIPIDDVGGTIHSLLTAATTVSKTFEASRDLDASEILGTVVTSSYSNDVTTVSVQIESAATVNATPAADYSYHVKFTHSAGHVGLAFVGDLELKEERA